MVKKIIKLSGGCSKLVRLRDLDESSNKKVKVVEISQCNSGGIVISSPGEGDTRRVAIEQSNGKLMCHVWAKPNADEPDYSIELK